MCRYCNYFERSNDEKTANNHARGVNVQPNAGFE